MTPEERQAARDARRAEERARDQRALEHAEAARQRDPEAYARSIEHARKAGPRGL